MDVRKNPTEYGFEIDGTVSPQKSLFATMANVMAASLHPEAHADVGEGIVAAVHTETSIHFIMVVEEEEGQVLEITANIMVTRPPRHVNEQIIVTCRMKYV